MRKCPPFRALQVFDAVAHHESFSAAAKQLCISQSAVSHQIKLLEHHLEETLINRSGRKVWLTSGGKKLFEKLDGILDELSTLKSVLSTNHVKEIRVATYLGLATRVLIPKLVEFQKLHPEIRIHFVLLSEVFQKLTSDDADIYITCKGEQRGYTFTFLQEEQIIPVCSPKLVENLPPISGENINLLPRIDTDYEANLTDWAHWENSCKIELDLNNLVISLEQTSMAIEAAISGLGVVLSWREMVRNALNEGRLIELDLPAYKSGLEYYVAHVSNCEDKTILDFKNWIIEILGQESTV